MHKNKPKKFGYEPKVRGRRAKALGPKAGPHGERVGAAPEKRGASRFDDGSVLAGRNPVTEAIKAGRPIEKILVQEGAGGAVGKILALAKENGIRTEKAKKTDLEKIVPGESHQGVVAFVSAHEYASLDDIFDLADSRGEKPLIVVLDGIEDPHNLGAILRSCECAGAHGVVIPKRNASGLTGTVAKSSAGAIEYVPCARVTNISRAIEELKERGVWVYALDMDGEDYRDSDLGGAAAIVIGAEGKGVSRLVKEKCDGVLSIPLKGKIQSLNASNAACVLLYEVVRQRDEI